jgi:hypothetical protein
MKLNRCLLNPDWKTNRGFRIKAIRFLLTEIRKEIMKSNKLGMVLTGRFHKEWRAETTNAIVGHFTWT